MRLRSRAGGGLWFFAPWVLGFGPLYPGAVTSIYVSREAALMLAELLRGTQKAKACLPQLA